MAPSPRCAERTPPSPRLAVFQLQCSNRIEPCRLHSRHPMHEQRRHDERQYRCERWLQACTSYPVHLTLKGGSSITGTGVTLILLPGATIDTKGGGTLTLTGPTSAPAASSLPASLQSDASLFQGMAHLRCLIDGRAIRWKQQHQHHRKHLRADRGGDVPGQPDVNSGRRTDCGELIAAFDRVQWQRHLRRQRVPGGGDPDASAQYVQLVQ